ncbi:hypothetical protein JXM67_07820 [candidate division WOR-3 bacterium]|nr:hypothetical protein [candidate division WOR-3 bacterium]
MQEAPERKHRTGTIIIFVVMGVVLIGGFVFLGTYLFSGNRLTGLFTKSVKEKPEDTLAVIDPALLAY